MAKHIITCSRCKGQFTGKTEYDAEIAFDMHECKVNGHTIDELTDEELTALVRGEKTEEQIWSERDGKLYCDECGEMQDIYTDWKSDGVVRCEKCDNVLED